MKKLRLLWLVGLMSIFSCKSIEILVFCNYLPPFIKPSIWIDNNKFKSADEKININGEDLTFLSSNNNNIHSGSRGGDPCGQTKADCFSMIISVIPVSDKNMDIDYLRDVPRRKLPDNYKAKKLYVVLNDNTTLEVSLNQDFVLHNNTTPEVTLNQDFVFNDYHPYSGFTSKKNICVSNKDLNNSKHMIIEFFDTKTQKTLLFKSLFF